MSDIDFSEVANFSVILRRIEPAKNCHRFYALLVEKDLLGAFRLVRTYGRIGSQGHEIVQSFDDENQAKDALVNTLKRKLARGYARL